MKIKIITTCLFFTFFIVPQSLYAADVLVFGQAGSVSCNIGGILNLNYIKFQRTPDYVDISPKLAKDINTDKFKIIYCDTPPAANPRTLKEFVFRGGILVVFGANAKVSSLFPYRLYMKESNDFTLYVNKTHKLFDYLQDVETIPLNTMRINNKAFSKFGPEWNVISDRVVEASYGKGHIIALAFVANDNEYSTKANKTIFYQNLIDYVNSKTK